MDMILCHLILDIYLVLKLEKFVFETKMIDLVNPKLELILSN